LVQKEGKRDKSPSQDAKRRKKEGDDAAEDEKKKTSKQASQEEEDLVRKPVFFVAPSPPRSPDAPQEDDKGDVASPTAGGAEASDADTLVPENLSEGSAIEASPEW